MNYKKIAITTSGLATVVDAVTGCKIRVISYLVSSSVANSLIWKSNATEISGTLTVNNILQDGQAGAPAPTGMLGVLETASGEALKLDVSTTAVIGGYLTYITVAT